MLDHEITGFLEAKLGFEFAHRRKLIVPAELVDAQKLLLGFDVFLHRRQVIVATAFHMAFQRLLLKPIHPQWFVQRRFPVAILVELTV